VRVEAGARELIEGHGLGKIGNMAKEGGFLTVRAHARDRSKAGAISSDLRRFYASTTGSGGDGLISIGIVSAVDQHWDQFVVLLRDDRRQAVGDRVKYRAGSFGVALFLQ
jgi:hypothetical protein